MRIYSAALTIFIQLPLLVSGAERPGDYFQQDVKYNIEVTLDDSAHFLHAFMELEYTNNSPDILDFIWFHIWPSAYKDDSTAFAKQQFANGSSRFHFAKDADRGYIDSLDWQADGLPLGIEHHPQWIDVVKLNLNRPLAPGETIKISTPFRVKLPAIFDRSGHRGNHYQITQWYPKPAVYDRDGWHPMPYLDMGEFYSEYGTFDVTITLPAEYVIMATGDLPSNDPERAFLDSLAQACDEYYDLVDEDGEPDKKARKQWLKQFKDREFAEPGAGPTKTVSFHQEQVHDFAWFANKQFMVRYGQYWLPDSSRAVDLWSLFIPKYADGWTDVIEYSRATAKIYGRLFGQYPYNHISAVSGSGSPGGAMEYPNITLVEMGGPENVLEIAVMHEVGHNWFYGIFGSNERQNPWMDEGLNSYAETRYWDEIHKSDFGMSRVNKLLGKLFKEPVSYIDFQRIQAAVSMKSHDDIPLNGKATDYNQIQTGTIVYNKTALAFNYLEQYLGTVTMDKFWQSYADTWSFGHPTPEDFRSLLEAETGENLDWFFDDILGTTAQLDYGVTQIDRTGETLAVTIQNYGELITPVEVATVDKAGKVLERKWVDGFTGKRVVNFSSADVHTAVVDPDEHSLDINLANNYKSILRMGGLTLNPPTLSLIANGHRPQRTDLKLVPWVWGNGYNGLTPGFMFYNGILPPISNRLFGAVYYDPEHSRPVGYVDATLRRYRVFGVDEFTFTAGYSDYQGRNETRLDLSTKFRKRGALKPFALLELQLRSQSLNPQAFDPAYWDAGSFNLARLNIIFSDDQLNIFRHDSKVQLTALSGTLTGAATSSNASLAELETVLRYKVGYKKYIRLRGWAGTILSGADELPRQFNFWLSGSVDPYFAEPLAMNRTGSGSFLVTGHQYIQSGPGLRAITIAQPGKTAVGVNLTLVKIVPGPFNIFVDIAATTKAAGDGWNGYADMGLELNLELIKISLPVWQSWNGSGLSDQWRIKITLPTIGL